MFCRGTRTARATRARLRKVMDEKAFKEECFFFFFSLRGSAFQSAFSSSGRFFKFLQNRTSTRDGKTGAFSRVESLHTRDTIMVIPRMRIFAIITLLGGNV
jgi:hypothetical protein